MWDGIDLASEEQQDTLHSVWCIAMKASCQSLPRLQRQWVLCAGYGHDEQADEPARPHQNHAGIRTAEREDGHDQRNDG